MTALLVALAVPATAQATWSAPVPISSDGAFPPQVAVDKNGKAVFVWYRDVGTRCCYRVEFRARSAAGNLGPIRTLSDPDEDSWDPEVAIDPNGNAVVVWFNLTKGAVQFRARSATGALSPVQNLTSTGQPGTRPQVAMDENGNAVFLWTGRDGTTGCGGSGCPQIRSRARSASGALGPIQNISGSGALVSFPQLAVDKNGNAVFVWLWCNPTTGCGGGGGPSVRARARSAGGTLSPVQVIARGYYPKLGIDQSGNAVIVWEDDAIKTRVRSAAGALSPVQTVSAPGQSSWGEFRVVVNAAGAAIFVWGFLDREGRCGGDGCERLFTRARSASGALSAVQTLSPPQDAIQPRVGIDQAGNATFLWVRRFAGIVLSRSRSAAGTMSAVHTISDPAQQSYWPDLAVTPGGIAHAAWQGRPGLHIEAALGP